MTKIKFKDLSGWLKAAIVFAWISGSIFAFSFLVGLIQGISSTY
jgi:hypothetical protein